MKRPASQSLQNRLIRLILAAVVLALLASVAAVVLYEITTYRPRALENAKTQADLVAEIIVPALEFDDAITAGKMLEVLRHEPAVAAAGVYRADGNRLAEFRRSPEVVDAPATATAPLEYITGQKIVVSGKVSSNGAAIGRVWLQADLPGWPSRFRQYGVLLTLIALAVIVLSLFISIATRRQITGPLHDLSETVQQVGQRRDLRLRVAETSGGEIGELAHTFNTMLETLAQHDVRQQEREARLARQNQGLLDLARAQKEMPDDPVAQSRRLTEILCEALDVQRAGVWTFTPDGTGLQCRDQFARSSGQHQPRPTLPVDRYPIYFAALEKERVLEVSDALSDRRTVEFTEGYVKPLGIGAMLEVPVRWRGRITGVLCLEHLGGPRVWPLDEVSFALSAADRVTLLLETEESRLAAEALRDSEERYRDLVEEARDAIFTLSIEGNILGLNQAVETITGWKRDLWIGRNFTDPLLPENRERAKALFAEVLAGGHPPSFELEIRTRTGEMVTMEFALSRRLKNGRIVGLLGIGRDVTERKQAGEVKAQLEAQLRQSQKMEAVGNLAGGIAHDFNNILTAIMGNTQLAELELKPAHPAHEYLQRTLSASHRAKDLVNQILVFSRRQEQKRTLIDLAAVVRDSLKLLRSVLPTSIEICTRLPVGLPGIMADETQVHQIVVNLATNAAHAMEEQGGKLEIVVEETVVDQDMVSQKPQLKAGRFLRLWVTDTGAGMDEQMLTRIFEPFFTTKETGKGTGLGLAVVHGIVQQHNGAIVVYSVPGKGTSFQIYFPVMDAGLAAPAVAAPAVAVASLHPPDGAGRCIMLVDDEELVLSVADQVLRRAGYHVVPFSNPVLALKTFHEAPEVYDLIITDLTMPHIKGTKLAAEIRARRPSIPIILATGFGGGLDSNAFEMAGLHGPLQKPFTSEALLEMVTTVLATRT